MAAVVGHFAALEASDLVWRLRQAGLPAHAGSLVTAPVIVRKAQEGRALGGLAHPALDQETAAVAEAARDAGVPFLGLRTVTDGAGEEIPRFLAELLEAGVEPGWGQALAWVAASPRRAAVLHHLWRRSVTAARRLGLALEVACEMLDKNGAGGGPGA
jgi:adenosylhomocysteine nucleosidase